MKQPVRGQVMSGLQLTKWLGMLLILSSCSALGMRQSRILTQKERSLEEILQMLLLLKGEIRFGNTTIRDACMDAALRMRGSCGSFLKELGNALSGTEPKEAFARCIRMELSDTGLSREQLEPLYSLGRHLGYLDTQMQLKQLELCEEEFRQILAGLVRELPQKQKLYRSLGFLGGMLLILLLW